jgi:hypothetical protein
VAAAYDDDIEGRAHERRGDTAERRFESKFRTRSFM